MKLFAMSCFFQWIASIAGGFLITKNFPQHNVKIFVNSTQSVKSFSEARSQCRRKENESHLAFELHNLELRRKILEMIFNQNSSHCAVKGKRLRQ